MSVSNVGRSSLDYFFTRKNRRVGIIGEGSHFGKAVSEEGADDFDAQR